MKSLLSEKGGHHALAGNVVCNAEGVRQKRQERGKMSLWTAEDYEPLPPGLYVGKLLDIESRESERGE